MDCGYNFSLLFEWEATTGSIVWNHSFVSPVHCSMQSVHQWAQTKTSRQQQFQARLLFKIVSEYQFLGECTQGKNTPTCELVAPGLQSAGTERGSCHPSIRFQD